MPPHAKETPLSTPHEQWSPCSNANVSPSGNRTPVSRVTGGDTHHYTNEDTQAYPSPVTRRSHCKGKCMKLHRIGMQQETPSTENPVRVKGL